MPLALYPARFSDACKASACKNMSLHQRTCTESIDRKTREHPPYCSRVLSIYGKGYPARSRCSFPASFPSPAVPSPLRRPASSWASCASAGRWRSWRFPLCVFIWIGSSFPVINSSLVQKNPRDGLFLPLPFAMQNGQRIPFLQAETRHLPRCSATRCSRTCRKPGSASPSTSCCS